MYDFGSSKKQIFVAYRTYFSKISLTREFIKLQTKYLIVIGLELHSLIGANQFFSIFGFLVIQSISADVSGYRR